jgi:hypothetical protein
MQGALSDAKCPTENTAEPALPGRRCCPLEGVTPQAAQGWALYSPKFSGRPT